MTFLMMQGATHTRHPPVHCESPHGTTHSGARGRTRASQFVICARIHCESPHGNTVQELYHYAKNIFWPMRTNCEVRKKNFSKRCVNVRKLENNRFLAIDSASEHQKKQSFCKNNR